MIRLFLSLYLLLLVGGLLYWQGIDIAFEQQIQAVEDQHLEDLARGPLLLTNSWLAGEPPKSWPAILDRANQYFPYGVQIAEWDSLNVAPEDWQQLQENQIFILDDALEEPGPVAFHHLKGTRQVLVFGPVGEPKSMFFQDLAFQIGWVVLASVLMLLWIFLLTGKLKRLRTASLAMAAGDLSARTGLQGRGYLEQLGSIFDRMAQRINDSLEAQKDLIHAVSHELRTPLSRLSFAVHFLASSSSEAQRQQQLDEIKTDVEVLQSLVDELLQYAHLDFASQSQHLKVLDLGAWLQPWLARSIDPVSDGLPAVSLQLEDQVQVLIFPELMEKALANLTSNARRFAKRQVRISLLANKDNVCLHVDDDGPGIPPAAREKVLQPFVRLNEGRIKHAGGAGLGAALANRIAQWHRGSLTITSSPLGGARFSLSLPRPDSSQAQAEATKI